MRSAHYSWCCLLPSVATEDNQHYPENICGSIFGGDSCTDHMILEVWVLRVFIVPHTSLLSVVPQAYLHLSAAITSAHYSWHTPKIFGPMPDTLSTMKTHYAFFGHFLPVKSIPNHQRASNNGGDQCKGDADIHLP